LTEFYVRGQNSVDVKLKGKLSWVRGTQPNKFEKWSLNLHPDAESLAIFRDLQVDGVKNQLKKDDDGLYFQISRPTFVEFRKGVKTPVAPPVITHADGRSMDGVSIGNGSDGVVTCEVYTHPVPNTEKRAKAMRWLSLEVTDLVPFETKQDGGWDGKTS
jgi:hypothetical protein